MSDTKSNRSRTTASGRFLLRIDPGLHAALREAAREAGLSLNDYCVRKLAAPCAQIEGPAAELLERAASLLGEALVGVVAYGSWAREETTDRSDVDMLVVVADGTDIVRELYRRWDGAPLTWQSRPVEPHFVHLPEPGGAVSGTWAEASVDGLVIFDRNQAVSRRLAEVRRRIVAGELVRREIHGQPYWVEAA
jgi:hypothetical protein